MVTQRDSNSLMVNGVLGESVTLPLKFPEGEKINFIFWLHNATVIATIYQTEAESLQNNLFDLKRKDQLTFNQYFLRISNLTMEDMGTYKAQINSNTSNKFFHYSLRIFRRLRNLKITSISVSPGNKTCEIHLNCSVECPNDDVSFTWQPLGKTGPNLIISWDPGNSSEHNSYTCIAKNPVSNVSSSVSTNGLCKDDTKNKSLNAYLVWIVISVISMVTVTVACTFGGWLIWRKNTEIAGNIEYTPVAPEKSVYAQVNLPHTRNAQ
ncbi:PREDICTED: SLAM family member 6 [Chrysochloris asiatica]|uniref:SLAM family member 6 n=1 Tax=Chrysochloris asiatica TaxID=185453 RepID=A0A9B0TI63_CHRAS|nr:PREDICTED: SLAM family member 6 [Chrysochloris asiatica]